MYKLIFTLAFVTLLTGLTNAQLYQGPANGSVPNGVIVSTPDFLTDIAIGDPVSRYVKLTYNKEEFEIEPYPDYMNKVKATGPEGSNYIEDIGISNRSGTDAPSILLKTFQGATQTNSIPPDTYIAAGPTHLMGVCNTDFYIWDKNGTIINKINANNWYSSVLPGAGPFDPKVSYDHFSKRWIMVWLDQNDAAQRGYFLISVSDDSVPTGNWYNWAIKSSLNGSVESGSWGDYQGVGFDNEAIYLTTNQFAFSGSFQYNKMRIVGKAQLYNNTAGPCAWTDLWDIRDPSNSVRIFGSRPSVIYGTSGQYYFLVSSPFTTGTYVTLYKLSNPLTAPVMTGVNVPVTTYTNAPNAGQLGGGALPIEGGGSGFRNEPVFRDGYLYAVHAVGNSGYSAVNYYKIDPNSNSAVEDATFGAIGYWHMYPALSVDKDNNIAMTYTRSGETEYAGAYYNSRLSTDPPGTFNGSGVLKAGEGNYVVSDGSRNRWGDYMGIWLDPSDQNNFWMHTEYAGAPSNRWANRVGLLRLAPYSAARVIANPENLFFSNVQVGNVSDTQNVKVLNFGNTILSISNISVSNSQFQVLNMPTFPATLNFNDSIVLKVRFAPSSAGTRLDSLVISSNDATNPNKAVYLNGNGFVISPASNNVIYGVTGSSSNGILLTINSTSGTGSSVGPSGFSALNGVGIRPSDNVMFSAITGASGTNLVRINSGGGDAYLYSNIPYSNIKSIAFDLNDELYCASGAGQFYKYNTTTFDTMTIGSAGITSLVGITFNPVNGQLFALTLDGKLYKVNKQTAASQLVGTTGQIPNYAVSFDKTGKLYGIKGASASTSNLITIDTASGAGSVVGPVGISSLTGIAISPDIIGIQSSSSIIPDRFELNQNYPNPFNPGTTISFSITNSSIVKLKVFDITGKEVKSLLNQNLQAGSYNFYFDGSNLASGVYYYRLETKNNSEIKKMILLK